MKTRKKLKRDGQGSEEKEGRRFPLKKKTVGRRLWARESGTGLRCRAVTRGKKNQGGWKKKKSRLQN